MNDKETLKTFLGFTNRELAMLLEVEQSTMAKYGKGQRKLPKDATLLMSTMIKYMCEGAAASTIGMAEQHAQKQNILERLRKENEYQLETVERKIKAIEKRYNDNLKALQLVEFLSQNPELLKREEAIDLMRVINRRATKSLKTNGLGALLQLNITLEKLKLEKQLLDAEPES
ncbi:hypothetical protein L1S35_03910 [Flavobacterium sp. AS60]|uniref:hypothetical protein n=1 Tax=Flavobacterium anseongense TaxID=2910677 RepID=UPI001F313371|nr:hypothetical protein [Flavobacterium sp. AS60]MCF6128803.1 hypothetical protein [Flavobacterium sp. AS60]